MLKAKNIIISIITMTAVLFSIVMIPNTAMADGTCTVYAITSDGGLKKNNELRPSLEDEITVSAGLFMRLDNYLTRDVNIEYVGIEDSDLTRSIGANCYEDSNGVKLRSGGSCCFIPGETLYIHWDPIDYVFTITRPAPTGNSGSEGSGYAHVHNFVHCIITNPTEEMDGLEGEQCVCGAIRNTSVISSDIVFYENLYKKIDNAKSGQTIVLELKRRNTFTKELLEKLAAKNNTNFVIRLTGNDNKRYEFSLTAGALDGMEFTEKYYGYKAVAGFLEMQEIAR